MKRIYLTVAAALLLTAALLFCACHNDGDKIEILPSNGTDPSGAVSSVSPDTPGGSSTPDTPAHEHSWTEKFDDDGHWRECALCGETTAKEAHALVLEADDAGHLQRCTACAYRQERAAHAGGTATCAHRAVCAVCGKEYGELDPAVHEGPDEVRGRIDPTENEKGYTGDTYCAACGALRIKGADIEPLSHIHTLVFVPAEEATHAAPGNIAYYRCSACGSCFTDAEGKNQIPPAQTVIPAIPHVLSWVSDAGGHRQECACGYTTDYYPHELTQEYDESAHWEECGVCGYTTERTAHTLTWRSGENGHRQTCPCGYRTAEEAHTGGTATCLHPALCTVCGEYYGEKDENNHEGPEELRDAAEATEDADGYTGDRYCTACGGLIEKGQSIPRISPEKITFYVEDLEGTAGKTAAVVLKVKNNPGVAGFSVTLAYDPDVLAFKDYNCPLTNGYKTVNTQTPGRIRMMFAAADFDFSENGDCFVVTFTIRDVGPLTTSLNVIIEGAEDGAYIANPEFKPESDLPATIDIAVDTQGGVLTVSE